jgi:hypothetical protein
MNKKELLFKIDETSDEIKDKKVKEILSKELRRKLRKRK